MNRAYVRRNLELINRKASFIDRMEVQTRAKKRRRFKDSLEDKVYKASDKVGSLMSDLYSAEDDLGRQTKKLSKTFLNESNSLSSNGYDVQEIYDGWLADEIDQAITDIEDDLKSFKKGEDGFKWEQSDQKDLEKDLKVLKSMLKQLKNTQITMIS